MSAGSSLSLPRTFVIGNLSPRWLNAETLYLRRLFQCWPEGAISAISVRPRPENLGEGIYPNFDCTFFPKAENPVPPTTHRRWLHPRVLNRVFRNFESDSPQDRPVDLSSECVDVIKKSKPEALWFVLNSADVIELASKVAARLSIPFILTLFAPVEHLNHESGCSESEADRNRESFAALMKMASAVGVASPTMRETYSSMFGTRCEVLIFGPPNELFATPRIGLHSTSRVVLGFAGTPYARPELDAFVAALSEFEWTLDGREVELRIFGHHIHIVCRGPANIRYFGWNSLANVIGELSNVDILYLPYWFDPIRKDDVKMCFPNKIATYVSAGRPVFFHGPADSSPSRFISEWPIGGCCHSMNSTDIIHALSFLVKNFIAVSESVVECNGDLRGELSQERFIHRFRSLFRDIGEPDPDSQSMVSNRSRLK